eukprot:scaffold10653_cov63-Phaeocystis_antarctica.AAC.3
MATLEAAGSSTRGGGGAPWGGAAAEPAERGLSSQAGCWPDSTVARIMWPCPLSTELTTVFERVFRAREQHALRREEQVERGRGAVCPVHRALERRGARVRVHDSRGWEGVLEQPCAGAPSGMPPRPGCTLLPSQRSGQPTQQPCRNWEGEISLIITSMATWPLA